MNLAGLSGKLIADCDGTLVDLGKLHQAVSDLGGAEVPPQHHV